MSHDHSHPSAAAYNPDDPHGEHAHEHGHTIVDWKVLVGVLAVLLAFTALTVSAAQGEKWIASAFDVILPNWMNVAVAMSIATVKGILVMMFFMQLRYDNPVNSLVLLFSLFAVTLFLFFSMIDLGNRNSVVPYKSGEILQGGTQIGINITGAEGAPSRNNKPIVQWAREAHEWKLQTIAGDLLKGSTTGAVSLPHDADERTRQIAQHIKDVVAQMQAKGELSDVQVQASAIATEAARRQFKHEKHEAHAHARGGHASHGPSVSDGNLSRPLTPEAIDAWIEHHAHDSHGAAHGSGHDQPAHNGAHGPH